MKIQIISDLHLEFADYELKFDTADVIIVAGDLHFGTYGVKWLKKNIPDKPVIYVLGNHEFYNHAYPKLISDIKALTINSNIYILENDVINLNGIYFLGCTLWTDFNLFGNVIQSELECHFRLNDFKMIKLYPSYSKIIPSDIESIHKLSLKWLEKNLRLMKDQKKIVITHYAPSIQSVPERFKFDLSSSGFASNLEYLIKKYKPKYWIHGHFHDSFDYKIAGCRVICNPKGYPGEENKLFNRELIIEI